MKDTKGVKIQRKETTDKDTLSVLFMGLLVLMACILSILFVQSAYLNTKYTSKERDAMDNKEVMAELNNCIEQDYKVIVDWKETEISDTTEFASGYTLIIDKQSKTVVAVRHESQELSDINYVTYEQEST